ncbi:MAG: hypothetical protein IJI45_14225 [Anaerolineaceae bacterium]|nr:hypothetical protein [Anaerolineaceae bacterium]
MSHYESGIIGTEIGNGDSTIADKLYIIQGAVLGKRESWNMAASKVGDGAIVTLFINGDGKIAVSIDGDYTGAGAHALVTDTALTDDMRDSAKDIGGWISVVNFKYSDDSNDHEGVTPQIGVIYKFRTGGRDVFLQTDGEFWYKWIQSTGSSGNWVKITNNEDVIS